MRSDRPAARLTCVALAALAAGCDGGSSLNEDDTTFHIRSLNLVENSPTLEIDVDETTIASAGYASATSFSAAHPGRRTVSFAAILPADLDDDDDDDAVSMAIGQPVSYTFLADIDYTLVAYGRVESLQTYLVEGFSQRDGVGDDRAVLQFTHASPDVPEVDVYVTAVQSGITTRQYVDTIGLTETTPPLELSISRADDDLDDAASLAADVVVELVATGTGQSVYRSNTIVVGEQSRVLMAITDVNGPGPAAAKLVVVSSSGSSQQLDRGDGAALRFMHAATQTPPLDVTVGSSFADPLAIDVGFRQDAGYVPIDDGEVGMIAVQTGSPGVFVFLEEFTATAGGYYTAFALGSHDDVDALVLAADAHSIPTQTRFRFLHGVASLEEEDALDIYLRLPGEGVDFDDDDTAPTFPGVGYRSASSYATFAQGNYDVYFAFAGTSTLVLGPLPLHVSNGAVTTFVLVDNENGGRELLPLADTRD